MVSSFYSDYIDGLEYSGEIAVFEVEGE